MDSLEEFLSRNREGNAVPSSEAAIKQGLILPILARLGWDIENPSEVVPEFSTGKGRVDYCLQSAGQSLVFIEAKALQEDLKQRDHQEQLLEYAFRSGIEIASLTNGYLWLLYLPLLPGSWEQRKFFTVDIQQQDPAAAAKHFEDFLGRDAVVKGLAAGNALAVLADRQKQHLITQTIPTAWQQLCTEPGELHDLLIELFADKVESLCGHRPDAELLLKSLASISQLPMTIQPSKPLIVEQADMTRHDTGPWTGKRPVAYSFRAKRHQVSTFKDILIGICRDLYESQRSDFLKILTAPDFQGRNGGIFSRDSKNMREAKEIVGSGIYVGTCLSAANIEGLCYRVLEFLGHRRDALQVELQERP